ncbi:hypothetical protein POTOM_018989 [Populus tomentosa]|uniref:Uncharacterized protein n=1 Tax=Populus tomentosa TaxID=118781 RepID=A0A8X7ZQM1_POPTO|nr:hypothetical protein POTOM_018989 [Populus tomentosa]
MSKDHSFIGCEAVDEEAIDEETADVESADVEADMNFKAADKEVADEETADMFVQEFPTNSTVMDLLERARRTSSRWSPYGFPVKEALRPRLNHQPVYNMTCKLKMGDVMELTPAILDKSLFGYKEQIQCMYERGSAPVSSTVLAISGGIVGWRS